MDNNNLPKTDRIIELLEELGELEAQKAVLLVGPYTPDYVASQAQDLTFQIGSFDRISCKVHRGKVKIVS